MRHRVGAVGGVQEEHARLAVVVRLAYDLVEQVAGPHRPVDLDRHARRLGLLQRALGSRCIRGRTSGKRSSQSSSSSTARMNASVMPTEMLKLVIWFSLVLQVMKSSMSG